jgi:hypothetical protein
MDLQRMLVMCRRDQWSPGDLDWSLRPRALGRDDEIAIVQLFTDMAGIERLARDLFIEQERRARSEVLRSIFATFIEDEERHALVAERLADFYNVHRYREYRINEHLVRFQPHFLRTIRYLSDDVANMYITAGELILDVALLRSLNDYVADEMSARAMQLINRDESRHIAIDYHMTGHYASPAYLDELRRRPPLPLLDRLRAWYAFAGITYHASPFFRAVFFEPMRLVDPSGRRIREAFKRMQLIASQPGVGQTPFGRLQLFLLQVSQHPIAGPLARRAAARVAGIEPEFMQKLYSDEEMAAARHLDFDGLAADALGAKLAG